MIEPIESDSARPQDVGRRHARKATPAAASLTLLERYQAAMRKELEGLLADIKGTATGQLDLAGEPTITRPPLGERFKMWELARLLATQLGSGLDVVATERGADGMAAPRPPRRGRIDF